MLEFFAALLGCALGLMLALVSAASLLVALVAFVACLALSVGAVLQPSMKRRVRVAPARLPGGCFRLASFCLASWVLPPPTSTLVEQELHDSL